MSAVGIQIEVHGLDDVTFELDTDDFLNAIGPVDQKVEDAVNAALDAQLEGRAEYPSQCWYSLLGQDPHLLHSAMATALEIDPGHLQPLYGFSTCNWENLLSEDFGGTLWGTADGRRFLTLESSGYGWMNAHVRVRSVECEEPEWVIAAGSSHVVLGCPGCGLILDTGHDRISWTDLTRRDDSGCVRDGLFCPQCGGRIFAEPRF